MAAGLTLVAVVVALGDAALVLICWRSRSVLAGILGLIGIPLVAFALFRGITRESSQQTLLIAGGALILGVALFALGRALERLLDAEPEE